MILFGLSILLSSFLLFQIQPVLGKTLLPWFGGSPSVWTTSLMFFQTMLAAGYYYAYWLIGKTNILHQRKIHMALIIISLLSLIYLGNAWQTPSNLAQHVQSLDLKSPGIKVIIFLFIAIGLPYPMLAANSPLIQAWYSRAYPNQSYSRFYALSNAGSLLGLLTYPLLVEPYQSLKSQAWTWAMGYILLCMVTFVIGMKFLTPTQNETRPTSDTHLPIAIHMRDKSTAHLWIYLSFASSLLLISVTNQISQEIAVIPFLWIIPLSIYLLSFILIYAHNSDYRRGAYLVVFAGSVAALFYVIHHPATVSLAAQIITFCIFLFTSCMVLHGELHAIRPKADRLTNYYLMISLGGMLAGLFSGLLAPLLFNGYWELWIALALVITVCLHVRKPERISHHGELSRSLIIIFLIFTAGTSSIKFIGERFGMPYAERNFFGVARVTKQQIQDSGEPVFAMSHGRTVHGIQFINPALRDRPTTYYVRDSGIGLTLLHHPRRGQGLKVGLIGLGIGTVATYGLEGDEYRMYEINPDIIRLAEGEHDFFSFLSSSKARLTTIAGDARISLQHELDNGEHAGFDILILDAFSSDSIPVHLLTKEAFALYMQHLANDGVIAAHISNIHLDLTPVFWRLAQLYGLQVAHVAVTREIDGGYPSDWLLLTKNSSFLNIPEIYNRSKRVVNSSTHVDLWTDDFSNLLQIIK